MGSIDPDRTLSIARITRLGFRRSVVSAVVGEIFNSCLARGSIPSRANSHSSWERNDGFG